MIRHDITTADIEPVVMGAATDTLLHVVSGSGFLIFGPDQTTPDTWSPVSAGEKMIIPAGGVVSAAKGGTDMVIVTGQWGP